jgi:hypothetical protein
MTAYQLLNQEVLVVSKDGQRKHAGSFWENMTKPKFLGGLGFRDIE